MSLNQVHLLNLLEDSIEEARSERRKKSPGG